MIHYRVENNVALIIMDSAPVNALGQGMRGALVKRLDQAFADDAARAVLISSSLSLFCGGADIEEFDAELLWASPSLFDLIDKVENGAKMVVAGINGVAMGGGLELALGCDYRIAAQSSKLGLPEIKLGLFPGAGGTQRLPRIAGLQTATSMILSGNPVRADEAIACGLVDRLAENDSDFLAQALVYVEQLIATRAPRRYCAEMKVDMSQVGTDFFDQARARSVGKNDGQLAAEYCIDSIERSVQKALDEALEIDSACFRELLKTPQARAMIHLFFAERMAGKVADVSPATATRNIDSIGIVGAGAMGCGIATACLDAGLSVILLDTAPAALDAGLDRIAQHYNRLVEKGRIDATRAGQLQAGCHAGLDYESMARADLVIEAASGNMQNTKAVFEQLDKVCKPGAVLASNTSTLDLNVIANMTKRPEDVIGLHFFDPENMVRLLEIVRCTTTSPEVIKTALLLARRMRKLAVVVGVCDGLVANRMLKPYAREGSRLLLEGATPEQINRVLTDFGIVTGMVSVSDPAGINVDYRVGESRREISDQEILERCLYPLINEGIEILHEGIAYRSGDCDLVWVNGYGFPAWRGGPLWYAMEIGLDKVLAGMQRYRKNLGAYGEMWFKPAPMLEQLVLKGERRLP